MRWAPQDYRTCRVRVRSIMSNDPMLRLVYLEALNALYEAGGSLPVAALVYELALPADEIARCLPLLDEMGRIGSGRGGLKVENGVVTNGRVTADLITARAYSQQQAEFGRAGGRTAGKGRSKRP